MKDSYKRRPQDFKRKILFNSISITYSELLEIEYKWLSLIKPEELGKKYYNIRNHHPAHWAANPDARTIGQKISETHKNDPNWGSWSIGKKVSNETKEKLRQHNLGKKHSEESKKLIGKNSSAARDYKDPIYLAKLSEANKNISNELKLKRSINSKRLQKEGKIGMHGKKHSLETKEKMKIAAIKREQKKKLNNNNKL